MCVKRVRWKTEDKCPGELIEPEEEEKERHLLDELIEWLWSSSASSVSPLCDTVGINQSPEDQYFRFRWQSRMAGDGVLVPRQVGEEVIGSGRQIFVPTNLGTNTFVFDTVSFLSILTLAVFLVRVFSRVIRWERRKFFLILGFFLVTKDKVCSQPELIQKRNGWFF